MGKINLSRAILGGLVAGVVINVWEGIMRGVILQSRGAEAMKALGRSGDVSMKQIIALNVFGFVVGILAVWLYAAIRPRMGAGPKTAMCAGLFVWATVFAAGVAPSVFMHILPVNLGAITVAGEAIMMLIAGVAGAYCYKEDSAEETRSSVARV